MFGRQHNEYAPLTIAIERNLGGKNLVANDTDSDIYSLYSKCHRGHYHICIFFTTAVV